MDISRPLYGIQGGAKKRGHRLVAIIPSNFNRFTIFFTGRYLGKFAVKYILLKIPSHLAYVATLPCWTLMSAKQVINDKLQGIVATYFRCGGVVNNQIKKGLLLSLRVEEFLKSVNIWQSYKQKRDCLVHFLRLLAVCWPGARSAWDNTMLLLVTLPSIHWLKKFIHTQIISHWSQFYQAWNLAKIGPVDFQIIGLTEIGKNNQRSKWETEAEHITRRAAAERHKKIRYNSRICPEALVDGFAPNLAQL